jgi:hypothetical protein
MHSILIITFKVILHLSIHDCLSLNLFLFDFRKNSQYLFFFRITVLEKPEYDMLFCLLHLSNTILNDIIPLKLWANSKIKYLSQSAEIFLVLCYVFIYQLKINQENIRLGLIHFAMSGFPSRDFSGDRHWLLIALVIFNGIC